MAKFEHVVDAYIATMSNTQGGILGRCRYWVDSFPGQNIEAISCQAVDTALAALIERGKTRATPTGTVRTGERLSEATINRYVGDLAGIFKYAKRMKILPRDHVSPTTGIEKQPERVHHDRYFNGEEVDRLITFARVTDVRWAKLPALIHLAYSTGLRRSALTALRWRDIDFERGEVRVLCTKNGDPHYAALASQAAEELLALRSLREPHTLIFEGSSGRAFDFRRQWEKALKAAGLDDGRTFHALRHGCGHALALSGQSQALIMKYMGHRSIGSSQRYMHVSLSDKQRIAAKVFG